MKPKSFIRNLNFFLGESLRSIARNKIMSLTSVATVAACVFIVIFSYCVASNIDFVLEQFENSAGIVVRLEEGTTQEKINEIRVKILEIEHITDAVFVSAEQNLEEFIKKQGDESGLLSRLESDNPLRDSFTVTVDSSKNQAAAVNALNALRVASGGIAKVDHAMDMTNLLISVNNVIRVISIIIILVLGVLAVVIIMNTIKLTVNNRRNEISIMKYVGATDMFIKWPFIIEGILIGVLGAAIPVVICWAGYNSVLQMIYNNYQFMEMLITFKSGVTIFPFLIPTSVVIGSAIGIIGSITSIKKYLDV